MANDKDPMADIERSLGAPALVMRSSSRSGSIDEEVARKLSEASSSALALGASGAAGETFDTAANSNAVGGGGAARAADMVIETLGTSPSGGDTPLVVGISGGTGSGKTSVSRSLYEKLGKNKIAFISHDNYYKDLRHLSMEERAATNFDHPESLDTALLVEHLKQLRANKAVEMPQYDFSRHARMDETKRVVAKRVILVEGILIFSDKALRKLMDIKIFVDADADIRFIRRLKRDMQERGRSADSVIEQYMTTVRPMHNEFVEPSKRHADVIVPHGGRNVVAIEMIAARIEKMLTVIGSPRAKSMTMRNKRLSIASMEDLDLDHKVLTPMGKGGAGSDEVDDEEGV